MNVKALLLDAAPWAFLSLFVLWAIVGFVAS
jgi:hypothetical protein